MQLLFQDDQPAQENIDKIMNAQLMQVVNYYNNQILVIAGKRVFLNTEQNGVMYFNLKELAED